MADYYSILAQAVNALDPNTGMARQQLYQRARFAMILELENVDVWCLAPVNPLGMASSPASSVAGGRRARL